MPTDDLAGGTTSGQSAGGPVACVTGCVCYILIRAQNRITRGEDASLQFSFSAFVHDDFAGDAERVVGSGPGCVCYRGETSVGTVLLLYYTDL